MTGMTSLFWSKASMLHKLPYFDETNASIIIIKSVHVYVQVQFLEETAIFRDSGFGQKDKDI